MLVTLLFMSCPNPVLHAVDREQEALAADSFLLVLRRRVLSRQCTTHFVVSTVVNHCPLDVEILAWTARVWYCAVHQL